MTRLRPRTRGDSGERRFRLTAAVAAAAAAFFGVALLSPTAAQAHNYLVASTPAEGETLTALPPAFSITTNGDLLDLGGEGNAFALQVRDAAGLYYGDGCVTVAGVDMSTPAALGAAGDYTVVWQAVSTDGHTISDEFAFDWAPAEGSVVSAGQESPPVCGEVAPGAAASAAPSAGADPEAAASSDATTTPSPTADDSGAATVDPTLDPTANPTASDSRAEDSGADALWIAGGIVAVAAAVVITLLLTGRRKDRAAPPE